ncbi:hypothetical protein CgunFtcFv8_012848 [Champsocephalus gunnari]|uniref:Uncharacterized protein n=1 Tax=Champsocephalus gunnari TaxID=52237 RepID=A0AAN8DY99_CHAGU|nr:hypothetical protein CgunFtcFv8_012848 [Champsocephalus gunnari]
MLIDLAWGELQRKCQNNQEVQIRPKSRTGKCYLVCSYPHRCRIMSDMAEYKQFHVDRRAQLSGWMGGVVNCTEDLQRLLTFDESCNHKPLSSQINAVIASAGMGYPSHLCVRDSLKCLHLLHASSNLSGRISTSHTQFTRRDREQGQTLGSPVVSWEMGGS